MNLALATVVGLLAAAQPPEEPKGYDPLQLSDLEALAKDIRGHVAYLKVQVAQRGELIIDLDDRRDGFGVVLDDHLVAVMSFIVKDAKSIEVIGRSEESLSGKVVLYDLARRVAIVETEKPLSTIGLSPAVAAPADEREVGQPLFALLSTQDAPSVVDGMLTDTGEETPEFQGLLRSDLELSHGMPVFDTRARFVGYSRGVAWDPDKHFLVPFEKIKEARTATGTPTLDEEKKVSEKKKPPKKVQWKSRKDAPPRIDPEAAATELPTVPPAETPDEPPAWPSEER